MVTLGHELLLTTTLCLTLLNFLQGVGCIRTMLPPLSPEGIVMEDKIRLGSTPPSCHNRCNQCNPCTAVQVPTLPGGAEPGHGEPVNARESYDGSFNKYTNYKPLGWKCRCRDHLYDP